MTTNQTSSQPKVDRGTLGDNVVSAAVLVAIPTFIAIFWPAYFAFCQKYFFLAVQEVLALFGLVH